VSEISFYATKPVECPVCKTSFKREVLRSGGGRLIADNLQPDLRRTYKTSPKFGAVNPLIFNIIVCPSCWYATLPEDFLMIKEDLRAKLSKLTERRKKYAKLMFTRLDFEEERTLVTGMASFFLALTTYSSFPPEFAPTTKKAICALRASWLAKDLHDKKPTENYDQLYWHFRLVAWNCYEKVIENSQTGAENFDKISSLGPDIDYNYGYDGVIFVLSYLGFELKDFIAPEERLAKLKLYRTAISKVFGFGRVSKSKPSPLVNTAKEMHALISKEITDISGSAPVDED
jgi:hypothetical protein